MIGLSVGNTLRSIVALGAVVALSPLAQADILVPGTKRISHQIKIGNLADFPDDAFFTYSPLGKESWPIEGGQPIMRSGNPIDNTVIVLIPKAKLESVGGKPDSAWFGTGQNPRDPSGWKFPEGILATTDDLPLVRALDSDDPADSVVTTLKLEREGNALRFKTDKEERLDAAGKPIAGEPPPAGKTGDKPEEPRKRRSNSAVWISLSSVAIALIAASAAARKKREAAAKGEPPTNPPA